MEEFKSRNLQLGKELEEQQVKLSRVKKLNDKAAAEVSHPLSVAVGAHKNDFNLLRKRYSATWR